MTTTNYQVGQTVTVKKFDYTIKQVDVTADVYPNTKRNNPSIELHIIVEGKRGALKAGFVKTNGEVVLF